MRGEGKETAHLEQKEQGGGIDPATAREASIDADDDPSDPNPEASVCPESRRQSSRGREESTRGCLSCVPLVPLSAHQPDSWPMTFGSCSQSFRHQLPISCHYR